jgi:diguanylate cyclase (GGDEF)-like protein
MADHENRMRGKKSMPMDFEMRAVNVHGAQIDCHFRFSEVKWDKRIASLGVFEDVTEKNRLRAVLQKLETIDLLTNLANQRSFIARLEEAISQVHRNIDQDVALLVIRLEDLRAIGRRFGNLARDAQLQRFSMLLIEQMRKADIGGRIDDEEFAILLSGSNLATASAFSERLRTAAFEVSETSEKESLPIRVRIGGSTIDAADTTAQEVLMRAREALRRGPGEAPQYATRTDGTSMPAFSMNGAKVSHIGNANRKSQRS